MFGEGGESLERRAQPRSIYLDHHATTPVDPRVLQTMLPYFSEHFGNASSKGHSYGARAADAVERARAQIASLIGATSSELVFTSGATESINQVLFGVCARAPRDRRHLVTSAIEHKATLDCLRVLQEQGWEVTYLPVDRRGRISLEQLDQVVSNRTLLASFMLANNEIGVVQDVRAIGQLLETHGILFHVDGAQGVGKIPFDVSECGADFVSMSAHKMYGPKGVGALYVKARVMAAARLAPLLFGGGQEAGLRAGTANVPGIVGLGEAAQICKHEMLEERARIQALRDLLRAELADHLSDIHFNGDSERCLPGTLNVSFGGVEGDVLLGALRDLAVSSSAACTSSRAREPSHVLRAIGVSDELAHATIRFGLGRFNREEEIRYAADLVISQVERLRAMPSL